MLGVKFIYLFCNDLGAMRAFYTDLLGMKEIYFSDGQDGGLGYDCSGLQFTIFPAASELPVIDSWAWQPGWREGAGTAPSWSVVATAATFEPTVARLQAAGVPSFYQAPRWYGYWSYPVKDPMGNTVELTLPVESTEADSNK